ncbi:aspartyl-phosphate phosphatase Spo0E family protein [Caldicellulosiruptoraceae bacterium PP1]
MIVERITKLREKLDQLINESGDYESIYRVSIELDKLILDYYKEKNEALIKESNGNIRKMNCSY